jgi:diguanylate cyclase (GGDEF)-like protein
VTLLQWLAGGAGSPYQKLYFLWVGAAMGIHPPRRALTFLGATALAACAPLAYEGWSAAAASDIATDLMLWSGLGLIILTLMVYVRAQGVRLRSEEARAQELARADALTGLGNRRAFNEALEAEMARTIRAGSTSSVALVDLDGLKEVNDALGHLDGDRCLRQVADTIKRWTRGGDRNFRWGGDEFALVLPDTSLQGAEQALERVAAEIFTGCAAADGRPLAVSWGVAELRQGMTAGELLQQADLALMAHKQRKGRAPGGRVATRVGVGLTQAS